MISKKLSGIFEIIFFESRFSTTTNSTRIKCRTQNLTRVYPYILHRVVKPIVDRNKEKVKAISDRRTIVKRKRENQRTTVKVGTRVYAFMRVEKKITHLVWNFCVSSWPAHIILLPNNYCLCLITLKYQSEELLPR